MIFPLQASCPSVYRLVRALAGAPGRLQEAELAAPLGKPHGERAEMPVEQRSKGEK